MRWERHEKVNLNFLKRRGVGVWGLNRCFDQLKEYSQLKLANLETF